MIDDYMMQEAAPEPSVREICLPANLDAEKTILGAVLLDCERLCELDSLQPDDFFLDSHSRIFAAMRSIDGVVDTVTLANELSNRHELQTIGGMSFLFSLTEGLFRSVVIADYIRILRDKATLRRMVNLGTLLQSKAYEQTETGLQIGTWLAGEVSAIMDESGTGKPDVFSAADMAEDAERRLMHPETVTDLIPFGIDKLDSWTNGGMRLGELWIIGAPPSRGKTTLARQIVKHTVLGGTPAYVHSGEMTKESWYDITACLIQEMPAWKVRDPYLMNLADKQNLLEGLRILETLPMHISDTGGIELDRLIFNATRAHMDLGIKLLVVDYAQIIKVRGKREPRDRVSEVAGQLREFAKAYNVTTVLLSQMARPEGRNINARPNMFGLKESGTLEESAHGVILPYLPVDTDTNAFTGEDQLIIGKQRFGPVGAVNVRFRGDYLTFEGRD